MTSVKPLAKSERYAGEADRRKRLGQFFTGIGLGRVLAALAHAQNARSIIDPMSGSGDLLAACLELGVNPKVISGIEIDPATHALCKARIPSATCILGNAFDHATLAQLPHRDWDLVITNPPYVRYQSMTKSAGNAFKLPGAMEVRNGLVTALEEMTAINTIDKNLFRTMALGYSGLADLAVPSLILCASMVKIGGRLAVVVPESWLSRDYAAVVHYLLLRWFQIEHVVEDEHATWFEDAQVKTTLLVARRVERKISAFSWDDEFFIRTKISGRASGDQGPISRLYPGEERPELRFAEESARVLLTGKSTRAELCEMTPTPVSHIAQSFKVISHKQRWFREAGEDLQDIPSVCQVPPPLAAWMGHSGIGRLITLEELGVSIGQGLRTGANGFFYGTALSENKRGISFLPDDVPGIEAVCVPSSCLRTVIRRQSELPIGFAIHKQTLFSRVLVLNNVALPEDISSGGVLAKSTYRTMPKGLAEFVRKAETANFGKNGEAKHIKELSAVAPNIRQGDPAKGIPPRFWYMLPNFSPRHLPNIIVPRVNGGSPRALLIANKGILADANFVTLNVENSRAPDAYAILALLNSAWCRAALENSASVMGGGALKVEATHLRRLPIPQFNPKQWRRLSDFGKQLSKTTNWINDIDRIIATALLGRASQKDEVSALVALAEEGQVRRSKHNKKS